MSASDPKLTSRPSSECPLTSDDLLRQLHMAGTQTECGYLLRRELADDAHRCVLHPYDHRRLLRAALARTGSNSMVWAMSELSQGGGGVQIIGLFG